MIKKISTLSSILFLSMYSMTAKAELYTNFYNNSKEALEIQAVDPGESMETNAKVGMEIKPQPNGYPPHIWFKATGIASHRFRKVVIVSTTNPNNWCGFYIPYNMHKDGFGIKHDYFYSASQYIIDSYGDFKCYIKNLNDNTAHLNIDRK